MATDISGRPFPLSGKNLNGIESVIAIPPWQLQPTEESQELLLMASASLPAGGAAFLPLTDPTTLQTLASRIPDQHVGVITQILAFCPDLVAAATPYLSFQVTRNGQPVTAWQNVFLFPRTGTASMSFDSSIGLQANDIVSANGMNTDVANAHVLSLYLYGWIQPKATPQGR